MRYLSLQEVISLHSHLRAQSEGSSGLRDRGALESAVAQPELLEIIIGHPAHQLILVNFTVTDEEVRIFSARQATRRERKDYEENIGS